MKLPLEEAKERVKMSVDYIKETATLTYKKESIVFPLDKVYTLFDTIRHTAQKLELEGKLNDSYGMPITINYKWN